MAFTNSTTIGVYNNFQALGSNRQAVEVAREFLTQNQNFATYNKAWATGVYQVPTLYGFNKTIVEIGTGGTRPNFPTKQIWPTPVIT